MTDPWGESRDRADYGPEAWACDVCGYVHPDPETPEECPGCDVGPLGSWTGVASVGELRAPRENT